jgi:hypothetical protein
VGIKERDHAAEIPEPRSRTPAARLGCFTDSRQSSVRMRARAGISGR